MPNIHEPGPEQIFSIFLKGTLVYLHMCCLSCIYHLCTSNLNYWICIDWIFLCLLFKLLAVFKKMLSKAHCEKDFNIKHNFFFIQTKGQETKAKESELDIWVCLKCRCHPWIIKYHWPVNYMWKTQMTFMIYQKEQHHRSQSRRNKCIWHIIDQT